MQTQPAPTSDRVGELEVALGRVRARSSKDASELVLARAAAVFLGLGILIALLGWLGASRTPWVFEQIPFLLSGGMLGVAVAALGGFLLLGHHTAVLVHDRRRGTGELLEELERLEGALRRRAEMVTPAPAPVRRRRPAQP
jgi:hypothetical protein